jgi:hypothetical protein
MYKNFNVSDEERKQILEQHKSYGYRKPLNENVEMDEQWYKDAYNKVVDTGKSALNAALHPIDTYNKLTGGQSGTTTGGQGATAGATTAAPSDIKDVLKGSYIRNGMKGNAVKQLQDAINGLNMSGIKISADGVFGPETLGAVQKVQKALGVKPKNGQYGIFGAITYNAMMKNKPGTTTGTAPATTTPAAPQTPTAPTTPFSNMEA